MKFKRVDAGGKIENIIEADEVFAAENGYVPADDGDEIARDQPDKSQEGKALADLDDVDRKTGMGRLMRETLIAIAGGKAPARLLELEAKAVAARDKLAKARK